MKAKNTGTLSDSLVSEEPPFNLIIDPNRKQLNNGRLGKNSNL